MLTSRIIPCLLLKEGSLVKTTQFGTAKYIGDPLNTLKIFSQLEVDELIILAIDTLPSFDEIKQMTSECFMPLTYGGNVKNITTLKRIFSLGVEKVALNTALFSDPSFVREAVGIAGSQSIVASIDVKKNSNNSYEVHTCNGKKATGKTPGQAAAYAEKLGVGEILLTSIDRDGTMEGYDTTLIKSVADTVSIPVIACGGAGCKEDIQTVLDDGGASAAAAGSLFVYQGKNRSVLINYSCKNYK